VSDRNLEIIEDRWPLVGITFSVLATFTSATILLWLLLLIVDIPWMAIRFCGRRRGASTDQPSAMIVHARIPPLCSMLTRHRNSERMSISLMSANRRRELVGGSVRRIAAKPIWIVSTRC